MKRTALLSVLVLLCACSGAGPAETPVARASGPADIDYDLVDKHAQQFDEDLPDRSPGSQQELAAGTYLLGHLQLAGYSPVLDAVPVGNQVQSSNVVALPPGGDEPLVIVAAGYDTPDRGDPSGAHLGLLLETARAVNVAVHEHRVGFAFLGAETAERSGSRELAEFMADRELDPQLIYLRPGASRTWMIGACALSYEGTEFLESVGDCDEGFFNEAGMEEGFRGQTTIVGRPRGVGPALFEFLTVGTVY